MAPVGLSALDTVAMMPLVGDQFHLPLLMPIGLPAAMGAMRVVHGAVTLEGGDKACAAWG